MGKRSNFERNPRDFYTTPEEAVLPLLRFVSGDFVEPCAGDGRLVRHLEKYGLRCAFACDIEPQADGIEKLDVLFFGATLPPCELIITNPPWSRPSLHCMIETFRTHARTWLLFDADWMHCEQAKPHLRFCKRIVSVGRVSWMGNGTAGMDNACWYEFGKDETETRFVS